MSALMLMPFADLSPLQVEWRRERLFHALMRELIAAEKKWVQLVFEWMEET